MISSWVRRWRRNPLLAAHHFVTVSLGMAAVTAVASVMYALAFQPLPLRDSPQIVHVWHQAESAGIAPLTGSELVEMQDGTREIFAELGGFAPAQWFLHDQRGGAQSVVLARLEQAAFRVLEMQPIAGRPVDGESPAINGLGPVWISSKLWHARYSAQPSVIGETVRLTIGASEVRAEIAGVLPDAVAFSHLGFNGTVDIWAVLPDQLKLRAARSRVFFALGRLKLDRTLAEAQAALTGIADRRETAAARRHRPVVRGIEDIALGPARRTFGIWSVGVALVLFLAFANLASLTVAEASRRRLELSVRASLGASRLRLWREIAIEQSVLTLFALGFGMPLAWITLQMLTRVATSADIGPPLTHVPGLNIDIILVFCGSTLASSLLWATLIVRRAAAFGSDALTLSTNQVRGMSSYLTDHRSAGAWRLGVLSVQTALGIGLIVLAVSLTRTYTRLTDVNLGPAPAKTLFFSVRPAQIQALTTAQAEDFNSRTLSLLRSLADVENAAIADNFPPLGSPESFWKEYDLADDAREATTPQRVSNDYFVTLGIPILFGRGFNDSDRPGTKAVAIIDVEMARRNWRSPEAAVNAQIRLGASMRQYEVIGVVGSFNGYWTQTPLPTVYVSQNQAPSAGGEIIVRARSSPSEVADRARQLLNGMPVRPILSTPATLNARWQATMTRPRVRMIGVLLLALMGLALGAQGVYALVASIIAAGTQDLAIRASLGASGRALVWLMVWQVFIAVAIGSLAGVVAIIIARRLAPEWISAGLTDPAASIALATAVLMSTALLAAYIPARAAARATSVAALLRS